MDCTPIFPEFDPELHPVGYALAIESLGEGIGEANATDRSAIPAKSAVDRFGWEFGFAVA